MTIFKLMVDKDKETVWLNEMAEKGFAMTGFCAGFYSFDPCGPGEYIYQVDITDGMFKASEDYRQFMAEMGVEIVALWGLWVILRKKTSEGPFVLYTDVETTIEHYKKIRKVFKTVTVVEILLFMVEAYYALEEGVEMGIWGVLVLGVMICVLARQAFRTNEIIAELYERQGRVPECGGLRRGGISKLLVVGMILNGGALLLSNFYGQMVRMLLQVLAFILMLVGLWQTFWSQDDRAD